MSRNALSNLVNGRSGVSAAMALRLAAAFGGRAEAWLARQRAYELARARRGGAAAGVRPVRPAGPGPGGLKPD